MSRKKIMASSKKPSRKTGKVLEFFRAISGFWPVWLSSILILAVVFGYQHYDETMLPFNETKKQAAIQPVKILPQQIRVKGKLIYIRPQKIQMLVAANLKSGYLTSDLDQLREFVEAEPWVKEVSIKRLPPDILQLLIIEQQAMLRWGEKALISKQGEVFAPDNFQQFDSLAKIISNRNSIKSGLELLTKCIPVMHKLELDLAQLVEDKLGAWEIETTQGVVLKLGRRDLQHRLQMLEKLWPYASTRGSLKTIDLRYANGAAVSYL